MEQLHQDILSTIRESYPSNGYQIVSVSTSATTESLYAYVMYKRRLYYLRFSAHTNEIKGHGYTSFNLLNYSKWSELRNDLYHTFLLRNKTNNYKILGYYNFVWLALAYRSSTNMAFKMKFEPADDLRKVTFYMNNKIFAEVDNPNSVRRLFANLVTGLITPHNAHIDRIYLKEPTFLNITASGIKILDYYPKVSIYGSNHRWLKDPRMLNIKELTQLLNDI